MPFRIIPGKNNGDTEQPLPLACHRFLPSQSSNNASRWNGLVIRPLSPTTEYLTLITEDTTADCKQAEALIDNIKAKVLLADRGYDSDAIVEKAEKAGMKVVIPPRKNRKIQREYNKELYKLRHFVENAFMILKRWRGVATRYAKNTASLLAAVQIRSIAAWVF